MRGTYVRGGSYAYIHTYIPKRGKQKGEGGGWGNNARDTYVFCYVYDIHLFHPSPITDHRARFEAELSSTDTHHITLRDNSGRNERNEWRLFVSCQEGLDGWDGGGGAVLVLEIKSFGPPFFCKREGDKGRVDDFLLLQIFCVGGGTREPFFFWVGMGGRWDGMKKNVCMGWLVGMYVGVCSPPHQYFSIYTEGRGQCICYQGWVLFSKILECFLQVNSLDGLDMMRIADRKRRRCGFWNLTKTTRNPERGRERKGLRPVTSKITNKDITTSLPRPVSSECYSAAPPPSSA